MGIIDNSNFLINIGYNNQSNQQLNKAYDPRDFNKHLNLLDFTGTKEITLQHIEKLYETKEIDIELRESLVYAVNFFYENIDNLNDKIKILQAEGQYILANALIKIQELIQKDNESEFENYCLEFINKKQEEEILFLKESITVAESRYYYKTVIKLYEELLIHEYTPENLFNYAYFLQEFKYYDEAIVIYEKILNHFIYLNKPNTKTDFSEMIAKIQNNMGEIFLNTGNYELAKSAFNQSLNNFEILVKNGYTGFIQNKALSLGNLAIALTKQNNYKNAIEKYQSSIDVLEEFIPCDETCITDKANTYSNIGVCYSAMENYSKAKDFFTKSLMTIKTLEHYTASTKHSIALILNHLGNINKELKFYYEAKKEYNESLNIRKQLYFKNPRFHFTYFISVLTNMGTLEYELRNYDMAEKNYFSALEILIESEGTYGIIDIPTLKIILNNFYQIACSNISVDFDKYYVKINLILSASNQELHTHEIAEAFYILGKLSAKQNNYILSIKNYLEAWKIWKKLSKTMPEEYKLFKSSLLVNLIILHIEHKKFNDAFEYHNEALKFCREIYKEKPHQNGIIYSKTLVMGVHIFNNNLSNLDEAESILLKYPDNQEAVDLLEAIKQLREVRTSE